METQAQKIRSINTPGWDGLDATVQELPNEPSELDKSFQRCFQTEDGQKVLEHLISVTINKPSWIPEAKKSYGYYSEGQNSIVWDIQRRIRRAIHG